MKISQVLQKNYDYDFNDVNILECGAYDGTETTLLRNISNCFYLEPQKELYNFVLKTTQNVFNMALSDKDDEMDFFITSSKPESSLEKPNFVSKKIQVKTIKYKTLLDMLNINKFHVLVLDIEGHETTVLKDIFNLNKIHWPDLLCIECGYDWPKRQKILREAGYIQDFYHYNNCYLRKDKTFKVKEEEVEKTNSANPHFIYNNTVIYKNDCT